MRHERLVSADGGFTLVEVVVAATLLLVGALATLALLDNGANATVTSRQRDVANALAQEMVERAAGGRYSEQRNDLTDVDPGAAPSIVGPADRMRLALDPRGTAGSTTVTPTTSTASPPAVDVAQRWTLTRQATRYTVSYRACTTSDLVQGVWIAGPYDCTLRTGGAPPTPATPSAGGPGCQLGLLGTASASGDPSGLTLRLAILGAGGLRLCLGQATGTLADGLCGLLGTSGDFRSLAGQLLGAGSLVPQILGGLLNTDASIGGCSGQVEQPLLGVEQGVASATRVAVEVGWTDANGRGRTIQQTTVVRRPAA